MIIYQFKCRDYIFKLLYSIAKTTKKHDLSPYTAISALWGSTDNYAMAFAPYFSDLSNSFPSSNLLNSSSGGSIFFSCSLMDVEYTLFKSLCL